MIALHCNIIQYKTISKINNFIKKVRFSTSLVEKISILTEAQFYIQQTIENSLCLFYGRIY